MARKRKIKELIVVREPYWQIQVKQIVKIRNFLNSLAYQRKKLNKIHLIQSLQVTTYSTYLTYELIPMFPSC